MKKLFMFLLISMFLINFVSAVDWDNYAKYENNDLTVKIKDSYFYIDQILNFGEELGEVKLTSHKSVDEVVSFFPQDDVAVMTYDFSGFEEYPNGIGNIEITNINNGKKESKDYWIGEIIYEEYDVPITQTFCEDKIAINGSSYEECRTEVINTAKKKKVKEIIPYISKDIPNRNITLGLITDVREGDHYDAVWNIAGVKLNKHAEWDSSLNDIAIAWWQFNETSGTNAPEYFYGVYNATVNDSWSTGKIGNGFVTNGGLNANLSGFNLNGNTSFTVAFHIKRTADMNVDGWVWRIGAQNTNGDAGMRVKQATDSLSPRAYDDSGTQTGDDQALALNTWTLAISRYNSSTNAIFIDDAIVQYDVLDNFTPNANEMYFFGFPASEFLNYSIVDEIGVLGDISDAQALQIYNGALGLTPIKLSTPTSFTPTIVYPTDTTYSTTSLSLNYTFVNETNVDSCWYSQDNGATNSSRVACGTNFSLTATEGINNWFVCGNVTDGTSGCDNQTFSVDTTVPKLTIFYPSNGSVFTTANVNINITLIETNPQTCWYSNDSGATNNTFTCVNNLTGINWEQGSNTIRVYANDTVGHTNNSEYVIFSIDSLNPNVTINYPTNNTAFTSGNININSTIMDGNLQSCWYSNDSGATNNTFTCGSNLTSIDWEQSSLIYIYANDSYGNFNYSSVFFTWLPFSTINESWSNSAIETSYQTFRINITSSTGYSINAATLNYNGTEYSASTNLISGSNYTIWKSIYIPPSQNYGFKSEIRYFNWTINITNENTGVTSSFSTDIQNHTLSELFFEYCGNYANETMLNLTLNDQYNSLLINASKNATTMRAFFNYGLTSSSLSKNYSMENLSVDYNSFAFCTNTSTQSVFMNMITEYSATDFSPAEYSVSSSNISAYNSTTLSLYLIRESDSLEFFITAEEDLYPIPNALVNIQKFFLGDGIYKSVEIKTTDATGKFTSYLELDQDYRFTIIKNGQVLGIIEKKSICEAAPCTLTLSITTETEEILSSFLSHYAQNVVYNLSYNPLTELVTFQFVDVTGTANYFRMQVFQSKANQSSISLYDKTLYTSSGSIIWNSSNYTEGDFVVKTYISRSPEVLIDFINFLKYEVAENLGIIGLFTAFLLVLTIIFGISFKPSMFIMTVPLSLSLFKMIGLISISQTSIAIIYVLGIITMVFLSK